MQEKKKYVIVNDIKICGKESVVKGIKAIGQSLYENADNICEDLENVKSISIFADIVQGELAGYQVTKNYIAKLKEDKKDE